MITWMQRHKKYLIVTIWISTIAFVGAGFVGWGQYNYSNKGGSVAQVGEIELTQGDLQKSYSRLYTQYSQMFQGDFDEERAKTFGLQKQALSQIIDQALLLNLAKEYDLSISNSELIQELKTQEYFFKDGVFNKETYKDVLSRNNLSMVEYEADLKKQLLITKVLNLLKVESNQNEEKIINTLLSIADKLNELLTPSYIKVELSDDKLKEFWEDKKQSFMTEVKYKINYIKQSKLSLTYEDSKIQNYYNDNKMKFKDSDGKILPLDKAKELVKEKLDLKSTKNAALRTYVDYKKGKISNGTKIESTTISASNNIFNAKTLKSISELSVTSPYMKPVEIDGNFYTIELLKVIPSKPKEFNQAKTEVTPLYVEETKKTKLLELAKNNIETFKGKTTDFITVNDRDKLNELSLIDANDFLSKLFNTNKKKSFIVLDSGNIVLYEILEQKLLKNIDGGKDNSITGLKNTIFNEGLMKNLRNKYNTEIFIKGL
jgi:peptidyl-prolyl cis-trans isomerase D